MRNFIQRTVFGILFVVIIIAPILISPYLFVLIMFVVNLIGLSEVYILTVPKKVPTVYRILLLIAGTVLYLVVVSVFMGFCAAHCLFVGLILLYVPFLIALFRTELKAEKILHTYYIGYFFVSLPAALMLAFYNSDFVGPAAGPFLLLTLFAMIWINDTFAYLIGVWLGKHRLYEKVSPKKSWEGSVGGLVFTLIAALLWAHYGELMPVWKMMGMALIVVVCCNLGDLIESMIKRQADVKDSGTLIPGHGGILDRFDAAFFVVPFVFFYLLILGVYAHP